jgi:hypothetical protein
MAPSRAPQAKQTVWQQYVSVITDSVGNSVTARAGDRCVVPRGFVGTWEVVEPTGKLHVRAGGRMIDQACGHGLATGWIAAWNAAARSTYLSVAGLRGFVPT